MRKKKQALPSGQVREAFYHVTGRCRRPCLFKDVSPYSKTAHLFSLLQD